MKFRNRFVRLLTVSLILAFSVTMTLPVYGYTSLLLQNLENGISQHVVTYGTSLTDDVSVSGAWVQMMADELESLYPGLATVTNSGEGNMDSTWAVPNLQSRVLDYNPDTVFIEFAINDAIAVRNISVGTAKSNLETMIDQIQAQNANCEIILMTMTHPGADGLSNPNRPNLTAYYDAYRSVSAERNLILIDHDKTWLDIIANEGPEKYLSYMIEKSPGVRDETHPDLNGCQEVVYPGVMEGLRTGEPSDFPTSIDPAEGLVAHYQFNGNLNDSVTGVAATAVGTTPATMYVDGPEGIDGQAINLSSDWYVNCGSDLQTSTDALTVSAWIYDNVATSTDHFGGIVMRDGYTGGEWGLRRYSLNLAAYPDLVGTSQMIVGSDHNQSTLPPKDSVPSGEWVHLAATYETTETGSQLKFYVNGVLAETTDLENSIDLSSTKDILFGYDAAKGAYFDGLIADVRIYNETLDATAIQDLFSPPIPGDANKDGKVDGSDVTILAGNWQYGVTGTADATWDMGDFNGDGKIDGSDVTILAGNWQAGVTTTSAGVPEPGTITLLLAVFLSILCIRRKK